MRATVIFNQGGQWNWEKYAINLNMWCEWEIATEKPKLFVKCTLMSRPRQLDKVPLFVIVFLI